MPIASIVQAKDDGRLPMNDFNTRVIAFGTDGEQAFALAGALVQQGFVNVKYFAGPFGKLISIL